MPITTYIQILDVKTVKDAMPFGYTNIDVTARDVYECAKKFSELKVKNIVAHNCLKDIRTKVRDVAKGGPNRAQALPNPCHLDCKKIEIL